MPFVCPQELRDDSVLLRRWGGDDAPALCRIRSAPSIATFLTVPAGRSAAALFTQDDAEAAIRRALTRHDDFAIVVADTDDLLGRIWFDQSDGAAPEVGYWLAEHSRGRGVATRALRLLTEWVMSAGAALEVRLCTHPSNVASQRVARRVGYVEEGRIADYGTFRDGTTTALVFIRKA